MRRRNWNQSETDSAHLITAEDDDDIRLPPKPKNWGAILRIVVCFLAGFICLVVSLLIHFEWGFETKHQDRTLPFLIIGLILFLPGVFYIRDAIGYAFGKPGYTIPE